jgi:hypothetical protein
MGRWVVRVKRVSEAGRCVEFGQYDVLMIYLLSLYLYRLIVIMRLWLWL